jgi:hypothetical protein
MTIGRTNINIRCINIIDGLIFIVRRLLFFKQLNLRSSAVDVIAPFIIEKKARLEACNVRDGTTLEIGRIPSVKAF